MSPLGVLAVAGGGAVAAAVAWLAWRLRASRADAAAARTRLAAVLESYAAGLAVWSPEGRLTACNGRFREFYPAVRLRPGLEYEDLVRYAATRAVVLVPVDEVEAWVAARLARLGAASAETLRTPDGRWLEVRTAPAGADTLLLHADVTEARAAAAEASGVAAGAETRSAELEMLLAALAVGRDGAAFHGAARDVLRLVAEWGGWDAGAVYLATAEGGRQGEGGGALVSTGVWHVADDAPLPPPARAALDAACEAGGDGVLEAVVGSGEPLWIGSLAVDPRLSDARRAALDGFRSLCAAPVASGGRVVAVAEFFARAQTLPDAPRERLVAAAVDQLARVFERERSAHAGRGDAADPSP